MKLKCIKSIVLQLCSGASLSLWASDITNLHRYIWANYNQFGNRPQIASVWYSQLLASQPPLYSYKGYINFLYSSGKFKNIVAMIPAFDTAFDQDPEIQLIFARALEKIGALSQADDKIIRLSSHFKTHQEIAFQAANSYLRRKEPENAIKAIDDLLNNSPRKPNNFVFHFLKAQIYNSLNKKEDALNSIKICLDLHKDFDKGWLFFALLEEELGQLDQAIKGFTHFLELTGSNREIEQHMLQLTFQQKIAQKRNYAFSSEKNCFEKALALFDRKQYHQALTQINNCLHAEPNNKQARLLKIEILAAADDCSSATQLIKSWIQEEPNNSLWYKTLHLLCQSKLPYQKAIAIVEDIHKKNPEAELPLLYLADLHMRTKTFETSLMYHKKALENIQDENIKTKILFQMGLIYYQTGQFELLENTLKQGLHFTTNFAPLLNLLAFHYASHDKSLAQAQQLMDTVLQVHKKNPHYLDTQALIYYRQKEYDKALSLLKLVYKEIPDNQLVLKHLGLVYYALGDRNQAITYLEKASTITINDHEKNECDQLLKHWKQNR